VNGQDGTEAGATGSIREHGDGGRIGLAVEDGGRIGLAVAGVGRIEGEPPAKVAQRSSAEGGRGEPLLLVVEQRAQAKESLVITSQEEMTMPVKRRRRSEGTRCLLRADSHRRDLARDRT
jgi:hypothetical protein